jgi:hypothetical protein
MTTIISMSVKPRGLSAWRERPHEDAQNPLFMLYRPPPCTEVPGRRFSLIAIAGNSIFRFLIDGLLHDKRSKQMDQRPIVFN